MKKLVYILAFAVISLQNCNAGQTQNSNNGNPSALDGTATKDKGEAGGTVKLNKEKFLKEVWDYQDSPNEWKYKGDKPVLIDFYADWCGACKIASPILEEISKEYAGKITVYKIDTQAEQELASMFEIRGIPAFLYITKEGKLAMMSGIARSKEGTKQMFRDNIDKILLGAN